MYDVIVIGAGPAGIMASIRASENNNKVLLIEKNNVVGKKLALTGGTRCNLTNLKSIDNFIREIPVNPKSLYSCLNLFGPHDIYNYFTDLKVPLKVEDNDRVFPKDNKASSIINALYKQLIDNKVILNLNEKVLSINNKEINYEIVTDKNTYQTNKVIISTGGKSYPITGSNGEGYLFAKQLNHTITKLYPAETFVTTFLALPLAGITLEHVLIKFNNKQVSGSLLFTHTGLSGPAIFKISEDIYKSLEKNNDTVINIDLLPQYNIEALLNNLNSMDQSKELSKFISQYFPKRLTDYIVDYINIEGKIGNITKVKKNEIINTIKNFPLKIKSTGSIEKSIVTGGGVDIKEINTKTMESKINKGIYFAGEVLDLHGHMGGYNITIALSTGYTAGNNQ